MSHAERSNDPRVERTRALVMEAAAELMMVDGPDMVTHANVAAAANVSRTTVYNHWPAREDLLRDTIESVGKAAPRIEDLSGDVRADLGILCRQIVDDLVDEQHAPMIANMMERALHDPAVCAVRDQFLGQFAAVFRHVLENGIATGRLRRDLDPDRSLAMILGSFLFARFMSPTDFDQDYADAILDDFVAANAPR